MAVHYLPQNDDINGLCFVEPSRGIALHLIELFESQFATFVICYETELRLTAVHNKQTKVVAYAVYQEHCCRMI
jgi:hypothetical protein